MQRALVMPTLIIRRVEWKALITEEWITVLCQVAVGRASIRSLGRTMWATINGSGRGRLHVTTLDPQCGAVAETVTVATFSIGTNGNGTNNTNNNGFIYYYVIGNDRNAKQLRQRLLLDKAALSPTTD
ncbi:unnamed protein product [Xylocopa violacea]|uniref:Uncharacterized protein n=1 Tax=Xylocopa violacea TaxID=135666 RepID=A0ABP1P4Q9_XYLVO